MKKHIFTLLSVMALTMAASLKAEAQVFILDEQEYNNNNRSGRSESDLPVLPNLGSTQDQDPFAPVGEGILLLGCLGGAYLLGKRRKDSAD